MEWFNGSYAGNSTNYSIVHTGGISLYWGIEVESESLLILATED
tara:strand:- start:752 stop:883 length:132 start_codon:yes stop_codon:yes gene_type:complete